MEGMPKVLLEAAACGRPVITTDTIGCRDAIVPDVTGLLVPVKNIVDLGKAMQLLVESPERCAQMGLAARARCELNFSLESVINDHMNIYKAYSE